MKKSGNIQEYINDKDDSYALSNEQHVTRKEKV